MAAHDVMPDIELFQPVTVEDASAIAAVLAIPIIAALARVRIGTWTASAIILIQALVLAVLDWSLGVPGAFLWMLGVGLGVLFLGLAIEQRRSVAQPIP